MTADQLDLGGQIHGLEVEVGFDGPRTHQFAVVTEPRELIVSFYEDGTVAYPENPDWFAICKAVWAIAERDSARLRASEAATAAAVERAERAEARCAWIDTAAIVLAGYERDYGEPLDDMHELGRIDESRDCPSFRIRVGHIRAALPTPSSGGER